MSRISCTFCHRVTNVLKPRRYWSTGCQFKNYAIPANDNYVKSDNKTHFGFQTVTEKEKEEKVYSVFENVAEKYDVMNDAMSVGIHRLWKDHFVQRLKPSQDNRIIDVAGGTGDVAFRCIEYVKNVEGTREADVADSNENKHPFVTVYDINEAMLNVGREKATKLGYDRSDISWMQGNAESLPFNEDSFDVYTVAFGIRNMTHINKVLSEAYRVLRPGGRFMCLEFSKVSNPLLSRIYDKYSFEVIPVLGKLIANDWKSYQYLVESIRKFPDQEKFSEMIGSVGFSCVTYENLLFGVAAIHSGFKI